jgi:hypothetical protein
VTQATPVTLHKDSKYVANRNELLKKNELKFQFDACTNRYQFELCRMTHLWKTAMALVTLSEIHSPNDQHRSTIDILAVLVALKGNWYNQQNQISLNQKTNLYMLKSFNEWVNSGLPLFQVTKSNFQKWDTEWKRMLFILKQRMSQNSNFVDIMQSILAEQLQGDAERDMDWKRIQSNYQDMWQNFIANDTCMNLKIKAHQEEEVYRAIVYAHWGKDLEKKMEKA